MKKLYLKLMAILLISCFLLKVDAYTPTCSTIGSLPYGGSWVAPNKVLGTQVLGNDNTLLTPIDTICGTDLPLLPGKASTETITGAWTFTGTVTVSSSGNLIVPTTPAGATSAVNKTYCSTLPDGFTGTASTTLDFGANRLRNIGAATTSTDAIQYQQAGKLATANNWDLLNTFALAPISSVAASGSTELARWGEVQAADSAITAGTCSYSGSAPTSGCVQGACHNTQNTSGSIVHYVCTSGGGWVQTAPTAINTSVTFSSSGFTFNGPVTLNNTFTVSSGGAVSFGGSILTNIGTPSAGTDAVTKTYADGLTTNKFTSTASSAAVASATETTIIGAGTGSLTLSANSLTQGAYVLVMIRGRVQTNGTPEDTTFRVKFGSTTLASGLVALSACSNIDSGFSLDIPIAVRTTGMSGTVFANGHLTYTNANSAADGALRGVVISNGYGTAAVDTTTTNAVDVTVQNASGTNSTWTGHIVTVDLVKQP